MKINQNISVKLFSNCIPVKGYNRSLIIDLQRNEFALIPNSLYDILKKYDGKSINEIKKAFDNKFDEIIDEYYIFLFSKELVFTTEESELFPDLNLKWEYPSLITNSIICDENSNHDYKNILKQLDELNCRAIQLRLFKLNGLSYLENILDNANELRIQDIEIMMPFNSSLELRDYRLIIEKHLRISSFFIFSSPKNKIEFVDDQKGHPIIYSKNRITNHSFCGNIHPNNFVQNIPFFTESQNYNTCLNRKVCIDANGHIKNCLSMDKHYGHIHELKLEDVVKSDVFQELWQIKKNEIYVCQDCEFRHMCMDCRAFIKDSDDIYSQPAKCYYNPYIAKWKGQEGYIPIENYQQKQKS